mgnify:CR=1 FL=1
MISRLLISVFLVLAFASGFVSHTSAKIAIFPGADLREADLRGANLEGVNLSGANLTGAILKGADISRANAEHSTFDNADLTDTNFEKSSLANSSLKNASLINVNFINTNVENASFTDATIRNVKCLDGFKLFQNAKISPFKNNDGTTTPASYICSEQGLWHKCATEENKHGHPLCGSQ